MFRINASDEKIAKQKKWGLLGLLGLLFIMLGLVALEERPLTDQGLPSPVAQVNEAPTATSTQAATFTPLPTASRIPTVTPTHTPTPFPEPSSTSTVEPTATVKEVVEEAGDVTPTAEAIADAFDPSATEISSGPGSIEPATEIPRATEIVPSTAAAADQDMVTGEDRSTGAESSDIIAASDKTSPDEGSGSTGAGQEQGGDSAVSTQATPETVSPPGALPTTGVIAINWGLVWSALGIILLLVGFGAAAVYKGDTWIG
jgi:hypothetical protein